MSDDLDALANTTITRSALTKDELTRQIATLGTRWTVDGGDLKLVLAGPKGMAKCGEAVAFATALADEMDHHPHIEMDYPRTTLEIHTHDEKAITGLDLVYAARLERWLRGHGW
jgi:pterin-4a-carbinolamine dehydratase